MLIIYHCLPCRRVATTLTSHGRWAAWLANLFPGLLGFELSRLWCWMRYLISLLLPVCIAVYIFCSSLQCVQRSYVDLYWQNILWSDRRNGSKSYFGDVFTEPVGARFRWKLQANSAKWVNSSRHFLMGHLNHPAILYECILAPQHLDLHEMWQNLLSVGSRKKLPNV